MSRVRFHQIKAIEKKSKLIWSGPGWDNYDDEKSVSDNLKNLCIDAHLLIIFDHRKLIGLNQVRIPKCVMMNEMHDPDGSRKNAFNLIVDQGFDLVICHHQNEMLNPFFKSICDRFYHIPHSANSDIFYNYGFEKKFDVMVCGNIRFEKYNLRRRYPSIIKSLNKIGYNCIVYKHPGGYHDDAHTDKYLIDFAKAINQSNICLTCSSLYKCAYGKYSEIPMCHSLLAGDLPDERQDFFSKFMLVINDFDSNEEIVEKIVNQLKNKKDIKEKTEIGYLETHAKYTMNNYCDKFLSIAKSFLLKKQKLNL